MNELHVTLGDRSYSFSPGQTVRIGRSPDNDIVVGDPTVSRQHAQLSCGPDGWEWENVGRALSFMDGQPITRARLSLPASVQLASGHGPVLGMRGGSPGSGADGAGVSEADRTSVMENNGGWPDDRAVPHPGAVGAGLDPAAGAGAAGSLADDLLSLGAPADDPLGPADAADAAAPDAAASPAASADPGAPSGQDAPDADSAWGSPEGASWGTPDDASWASPEGGSPPDPSPWGTPEASPYSPSAGADPYAPSGGADPYAPSGNADPYAPSGGADPYAPAGGADPYGPAGAGPQPGTPEAAPYGSPEAPAWSSAGSAEAAPPYAGPDAPPSASPEAAPPPAPEGAAWGSGAEAAPPYGPAGAGPYGTQQGAPQTAWEGEPYPGGQPYPGWQPPPDGAREAPRVRPVSSPPVDEIATALHILVPIRSWLHDSGWRQFVRLLVIPYGLLPLVFIALFASSNDLSTPGWAYSLYIAPLWAIVFWLLIRPGTVGRREIGIAAGSIVFALIWIRIVTININGLMGKAGRPLSFPGALGVGINEEITKALPIFLAAILLLRMRQIKLDVRMWMFLGTLVGLAFGVTEQAGYTTLDIEGISAAKANSQAIVEVLAFAERVFVDGFQHAMWAGVSAFFIGMAINYPRRRIQLIAFGITVPAVLHGLYDWSAGAFASLWVPIIVQAISLFLFLGYTMSAAAIEQQVRQTPMFRGESMIMERISDQQLSQQRRPRP